MRFRSRRECSSRRLCSFVNLAFCVCYTSLLQQGSCQVAGGLIGSASVGAGHLCPLQRVLGPAHQAHPMVFTVAAGCVPVSGCWPSITDGLHSRAVSRPRQCTAQSLVAPAVALVMRSTLRLLIVHTAGAQVASVPTHELHVTLLLDPGQLNQVQLYYVNTISHFHCAGL
eukprot:GHUV01001126.1.p1 GENE.GHUV01001126.1~~GHUV01001126.1.p1  ORF type:complete len:170 (+),score=33.46 GHUV01001126.1:1138-1647(+)